MRNFITLKIVAQESFFKKNENYIALVSCDTVIRDRGHCIEIVIYKIELHSAQLCSWICNKHFGEILKFGFANFL